MARWNTFDSYNTPRNALVLGPHVPIAAFALVASIPGIVVTWLMSAPLTLPAFCQLCLVNAGCAALLAWCLRVKRNEDPINLWDVAGLYASVGFAAGMISKPEHVLQLVGAVTSTQ
jgi:hypothetical protein